MRPDGVIVAETRQELAFEALTAPIAVTADGLAYENAVVWAGADSPGATAVGGWNCNGWTGPTTAILGSSASTYAVFMDGNTKTCSGTTRVLCMQTGP